MTFRTRLLTRLFHGLMALWLLALPLRAQLDPRLQVTSTDFLDLYQQSSVAKVKPEMMTLFDFSGSMIALMFHPAYRNIDIADTYFPGDTISFQLNAGQAASQVYKIRATTLMDPQVYTEMTVTVGASGTPVVNSGANMTDSHGSGSSRRALWTSISNMTITPSGSISNGTTYTFSAKVTLACNTSTSSSTPSKPLSDYVAKSGSLPLNGGINWTVSGYPGSASGTTTATVSGTSATSWTSPAQTFQWIAVTGTATPSSVSASFSTFNATCTQLVKPNGTVVTAGDAASANNTLSDGTILYGGSAGASDVRNWVRAASHARFTYNDGGVTRTVDVPLPWKVLDLTSNGSPLSSATVSDAVQTITNPDGTTTSWGSGQNIEVDQAYKVTGGSVILSGPSSTQTSTTLNHVGYHIPYLTFLFTGKYADGPYYGKYIVYDAADASLGGGQGNASWGQGFGAGIPSGTTLTVPSYGEALNTATRPYLGDITIDASTYVVPARTRVQAVKEAAISSWVKYQNDVLWAFRYIGSGGTNSMTNDSTTTMNNTTTPNASAAAYGTDTGWTLLNGNSLAGMQRISYILEQTDTPLTYAVSRSLAQFTDPNNVFNSVETGAQKASQCMSHFLIVFTDGADNVGTLTNTSPYLDPTTLQGNAWTGNQGIISNPGRVDQGAGGTNYWNLYTFAAIGAHLSDSSIVDPATGVSHYMPAPSSYPTSSSLRDAFLPYSILQRGAPSSADHVTFDKPHRITTMTVGVSLGGTYLDPNAPKYRLFAAAAIGDPTATSWNLNNLLPFDSIPDPNDSSRLVRKPGTTNFFDGANPTALRKSLDVAIQQILLPSNINSTTNPNLPFIGAALGNEVYLGKFKPPANGGVLWPGDLMMFGSRQVSGQTLLVDKTNNLATLVDASTAIWTTSSVLSARNWAQRNLYTRIPGNSSNPEYGLSPFSDIGTAYSDNTTGLKKFVATSYSTDVTRQRVIQFAAGGDTTGAMDTSLNPNGRPVANRSTIMGDIINSSPGVLEYNFADVQATGNLTTTLNSAISSTSGVVNRFRLLLVGTNQGWLHAFGEVSNLTQVPDPANASQQVTKVSAAVDELWAFMPTDFLAKLDYITQAGNSHQFMVDGTPSIYFLDLPPSSGGSGNGVLDIGSSPATTQERAIAIIGLRKGGRSYYALDIHDPFHPALKWALVPDEASNFPASRIASGCTAPLSTVRSILANWGFSSCTPGLGRIMFNGVLRDAVFLGGGFSRPEIEVNFPDSITGNPTPLGRSVIALDVYTGEVLAAVDMTGTAGPITAGLVPFEFFLNSGMAQRSYFLDYNGGLWSWGLQAVASAGAYSNYRTDSSDVSSWSVRKVAQDGSGKNALYSTLPAPFRVGNFPGQGKSGAPTPAVVGVAMISGDRNNPLDLSYTATNKPTQHRLTVVFDRQDHKAWDSMDAAITDGSLLSAGTWVAPATVTSPPTNPTSLQAGDPLITPGAQTYYLAPHDALGNYTTPMLGYFCSLPIAANGFISKGINSPLVVAGALFYSYFTPQTADPCSGGSGSTFADLICDALNPIALDSRTTVSCRSGNQFTWSGVASDFVTIGTQGVLQAGVVPAVNPLPGQSLTTIQLQTILGNRLEKYPKVRTWRTIH